MPILNQRRPKQFRTRGPFDDTVDYLIDDRVSHGGNSYVAPENIPAGEGAPNPGTNRWVDDPGSEGVMGNMGGKGDGMRAVYIRAPEGTTPPNPTGTWDGTTLTLTGGWSETEPSGTDILWRADVELDSTANTATFTAVERWTGPKGDEPSSARLTTLLTATIASLDLQDTAGVESIIQSYLQSNNYQTLSNVQQLLNQAYLNVLRDLGAIQVQYSLDGIDYEDMLNTYNYVRVRLNNPDADWNIIELGGTRGGGITVMDITTEYSVDGVDNWHETLAATDRYFRVRIGTGTPSAAFLLPRLLRHYVEDANVSHVNNRITLTIPGVSAYLTGMEVEFEVVGAATAANVELQINNLPFQKLLKFDGTEFRTSELRQGVKIVAVYNGTDFVSDFTEKPSFHYVEPSGVVVSADGNDYELVDTDIIGLGITPPAMLGFETKRANTGNMTLVVNGSAQLPLRLSDGSEIPAAALQNDQFVLVVWTGTGWNIINVMPARSLRGTLLATANIPVGTHAEDTIFPWAVESGVSYVTSETLPASYIGGNVATNNGALKVPLTRGTRIAQLGWYLEIVNNNTVVYERHYPFNEYVRSLGHAVTGTDGIELNIVYWEPFPAPLNTPLFVLSVKNFLGNNTLTIAAGNTYQVRLYLSEN